MSTKNQLKSIKKSLEWRRDFVLDKLCRGWSQQDISNELHLHKSTISLDCKFLSEQSQRDLRDLVDKRVPTRYLQCDVGLQAVLKRAWSIVDDPNSKTSEVISSLALISNLYDKLMELSVNGEVLSKGLSIIERTKAEILRREQQLSQLEQRQSDTAVKEEENDSEEQEMDTSQYKF